MFLTSTSDIIRIVTGSGVSTIGVEASWVDIASSTVTPGRTNTAITTATTTTVVDSPGSSTTRNVRHLSISNNHATSSCVITIQHFDGTTSIDIEKITLNAGERFVMAEDGEWRHLTAYGGEYEHEVRTIGNLGLTGCIAETIRREMITETAQTLTSGTLKLEAIYLKAGMVISNISFHSSATAANGPTNQIFGIFAADGRLLAETNNDTTTAWAAQTLKTLALTSSFTVPRTGYYYLGILVTSTTANPSLKGLGTTASVLSSFNPNMRGNSNTGLTTALPNLANLPGASTSAVWAMVS